MLSQPLHCRHPFQQGGTWKIVKKCKRGDPEHFDLIRGEMRVFFMFSWGAGVFWDHFGGGYTHYACHELFILTYIMKKQNKSKLVEN